MNAFESTLKELFKRHISRIALNFYNGKVVRLVSDDYLCFTAKTWISFSRSVDNKISTRQISLDGTNLTFDDVCKQFHSEYKSYADDCRLRKLEPAGEQDILYTLFMQEPEIRNKCFYRKVSKSKMTINDSFVILDNLFEPRRGQDEWIETQGIEVFDLDQVAEILPCKDTNMIYDKLFLDMIKSFESDGFILGK